ncbi:MAG: flavodoxin family protein, partial [Candidatus Thorarchaeota archaeon]
LNVLVVYETKFGNTKKVAETIAEGMQEIAQIKIEVINVNEVEISRVHDFDAIIIGSPTWGGNSPKPIRNFINELADLQLKEKYYAVFDTNNNLRFLSNLVKKLEKRIDKKVPYLKRILPGLPVRVIGLQGPIAEGELPKCRNFGKELALKLQ